MYEKPFWVLATLGPRGASDTGGRQIRSGPKLGCLGPSDQAELPRKNGGRESELNDLKNRTDKLSLGLILRASWRRRLLHQ